MDFFATHILRVILFTPLVGSILLLFVPRESGNAHRVLGNLFGMLGFIVSLPLVAWFQVGKSGYQFQETASWIPSIGATYHLGIDGISFLLVMLTTLLGAISILSSWSAIQLRKKEYYILFLLLQTGLLGVLLRLRHQGADVPVSHLAAGCAHRSSHGGLGHSGRRPAENGNVRLHPLFVAAAPARPRRQPQNHHHHGGALADWHRVRRAGLHDAEGHEEADCL